MTDWFLHDRLINCRRVFIRDLNVSAAIGVFSHEQGRSQQVRMNIEFWVPIAQSTSQADQLEDVVDYDFVRPGIHCLVAQGHIGLVETLVDKTIALVLANPKVLAARVQAEKSEAYPDCAGVGIEVFRFREASL